MTLSSIPYWVDSYMMPSQVGAVATPRARTMYGEVKRSRMWISCRGLGLEMDLDLDLILGLDLELDLELE